MDSVKRTVFEKGHVEIIHSRTIEKTSPGGPRSSEGVFAELGGIEIRLSITEMVIQFERAACVVRLINAIVVDAIRFGSEQRIVTVIDQGHGKAAC